MANENISLGKVRIADDVIVIIAELALNDVEGIYSTDKRKTRRNIGKGIEVRVVEDQVFCDIEVFVGYDVKIPTLAEQIQSKVKNAIENMTGMCVSEVNITVAGLVKDEPTEEA